MYVGISYEHSAFTVWPDGRFVLIWCVGCVTEYMVCVLFSCVFHSLRSCKQPGIFLGLYNDFMPWFMTELLALIDVFCMFLEGFNIKFKRFCFGGQRWMIWSGEREIGSGFYWNFFFCWRWFSKISSVILFFEYFLSLLQRAQLRNTEHTGIEKTLDLMNPGFNEDSDSVFHELSPSILSQSRMWRRFPDFVMFWVLWTLLWSPNNH